MNSQVETTDQIRQRPCGSGGGALTTTNNKWTVGLLPNPIKVGRLKTLPTPELDILDMAVAKGFDEKAMKALVVLIEAERDSTDPASDPLIEELRTMVAAVKLRAARALEAAQSKFDTPTVTSVAAESAARLGKRPDHTIKARAAKKSKAAA